MLQTDFTGGEPLARTDIVDLVRAARTAGLYVNLITSGLPLDEARLDALLAAGLDHFQLSFQGANEVTAEEISGTKTHAQKLRVLEWLKPRRVVVVTLNFVIHRRNMAKNKLTRDAGHRRVFKRLSRGVRSCAVLRLGLCQSQQTSADTRDQLDGSLEVLKQAQ